MGKDVFEAARAFAKMDKLWKIHFRNVSSPVPRFVETFVDNGYTDMVKLMRTLYEVDFRGVVIATLYHHSRFADKLLRKSPHSFRLHPPLDRGSPTFL